LVEIGASVKLIGFARFEGATDGSHTTFVLARTQDGRLGKRVFQTGISFLKVYQLRSHLKDADVIICRNLEALVLGFWASRTIGIRVPIHYECLDIHRTMLMPGPSSRILRFVERQLLKRSASLITSSEAFVSAYFLPIQRFKGTINLLENKVIAADYPLTAFSERPPNGPPWIIGWFGIIRCRKSLLMLDSISRNLDVQIKIGGRIAAEQIPDFEEILNTNKNISYSGPYVSGDIAELFASCHFIWAIDFYEEGENSAWLLPNRLYDAVAFKRIPIALTSVETGRWLKRYMAGVLVTDPVTEITHLLENLTEEEFAKLTEEVNAVPKAAVFHAPGSLDFVVGQASRD
jgi:hypothetical protein